MTTKTINPSDYPRIVAEHNEQAFGFLSRTWAVLETRYRQWQEFRTTVNELERLNDRELADIGIVREDIRRVARGSTM